MPQWTSASIGVCLALITILIISDFVMRRSARRLVIALLVLLVTVLLLYVTTGFPFPPRRQAFGGQPPILAIGLMFLGVVLGIAATYVFNLAGSFSWRDFLRPLVASPIVLLPLIGSVQGAQLEPMQLVSFTVLAFQNGFFWQQVLKDAKPKT
jgi:hypothetical protein